MTNSAVNKREPWDMGHKPGYEHWRLVRGAEENGLARKEFLDEFSQTSHCRSQLPSSNRSHAGEIKFDIH